MDEFHADEDIEGKSEDDVMKETSEIVVHDQMKKHDIDPADIEVFCTLFKRINKNFTDKYENDKLKQTFNNWLTQL